MSNPVMPWMAQLSAAELVSHSPSPPRHSCPGERFEQKGLMPVSVKLLGHWEEFASRRQPHCRALDRGTETIAPAWHCVRSHIGSGGGGEVCCAAQLHPKRQMIANRNMNIWDATDDQSLMGRPAVILFLLDAHGDASEHLLPVGVSRSFGRFVPVKHVHVHVLSPSRQDAQPPVETHRGGRRKHTTHSRGHKGSSKVGGEGRRYRCEGGGTTTTKRARSQPLVPARTYTGPPRVSSSPN